MNDLELTPRNKFVVFVCSHCEDYYTNKGECRASIERVLNCIKIKTYFDLEGLE